MANRLYYDYIRNLSIGDNFRFVSAMSDDQIEKQRPMEYVCRFLVHLGIVYDGKLDVEEFINEGVVSLAEQGVVQAQTLAFEESFRLLREAFGDGALRRFVDGQPRGRVSLAVFEIVALGIGKNILAINARADPLEYVRQRIMQLWASPDTDQFFSAGMRGTTRIQRTVPFGALWFAND